MCEGAFAWSSSVALNLPTRFAGAGAALPHLRAGEPGEASTPPLKSVRSTLVAQVLGPGIILCATVAMAAQFLSEHYGAPVMLFALLLGMAFNYINPQGRFMPGVTLSSRTILRIGVALLGARITVEEVLKLGPSPLVLTVCGVALTLLFGALLARRSILLVLGG